MFKLVQKLKTSEKALRTSVEAISNLLSIDEALRDKRL